MKRRRDSDSSQSLIRDFFSGTTAKKSHSLNVESEVRMKSILIGLYTFLNCILFINFLVPEGTGCL